MRKLFLATVAASALAAGSAFAADLPARVDAPAPAPIFVGVNWAGFYIGADAGYAWGRANSFDVDNYNGAPRSLGYNVDGFTGNLNAGYNFQSGALVYGLEAEIGYLGLEGSRQFPAFVGVRLPTDSRSGTDGGAYGALSARLGFSFGQALLYVRGGVAAADLQQSFIDNDPTGTTLVSGTKTDDWRIGYTVGAGLAYKFNANWSARIEYNYYDFGNATHTAVTAGGTPFRYRHDLKSHSARIGLTYHFGGPAGAVVAKY